MILTVFKLPVNEIQSNEFLSNLRTLTVIANPVLSSNTLDCGAKHVAKITNVRVTVDCE